MSLTKPRTIGVVGGGILGLATARAMTLRYPGVLVTVFEKEDQLAAHQTGRNSGVVHAGVYYKPGSLKAVLCRRGAGLLREYAQEHDIRYSELGKLILAADESELGRLQDIEKRAIANGVPGIRRIGRPQFNEIEPHVTGVEAIYSPHTASIDYRAVCHALESEVAAAGGSVRRNAAVTAVVDKSDFVELASGGQKTRFDQVIVCAGLHSDEFARMLGRAGEIRIVPFRGEYYDLRPPAAEMVRGMVYPVPDPQYPFLGVHLTRDVHNRVRVGPNAVMAAALEGYRWRDLNPRDVWQILTWPGAWQLAGKHWKNGVAEMYRSLSKQAYVAKVRRYLPALSSRDLVRSTAGVRAQVVDRRGGLVDDFVIEDSGRVLLVRNAPSPAATSSLAIAEHIADVAAGERPSLTT
jgi:(S)-2-hydroxyglutarate dehydrogenase